MSRIIPEVSIQEVDEDKFEFHDHIEIKEDLNEKKEEVRTIEEETIIN